MIILQLFLHDPHFYKTKRDTAVIKNDFYPLAVANGEKINSRIAVFALSKNLLQWEKALVKTDVMVFRRE